MDNHTIVMVQYSTLQKHYVQSHEWIHLMVVFVSFFTVAWGSYFDHALAWEKLMDNPNILMVTYEQMKEVKPILCIGLQK